MSTLPEIVKGNFFPESFRVLYMKMQAALSMRGFLEALRELLEELEWNESTAEAYQFFAARLKRQEDQDSKHTEVAIKWLHHSIKMLLQGLSKKAELKELIQPQLSKMYEEIQRGNVDIANYVHALVLLLEHTAKDIASYGETSLLKDIGNVKIINVSLPSAKDPLEHIQKEKTVLPFTLEGDKIKTALGTGFIKARVLPPTEHYKANRYFIDQGLVQIDWPEAIRKIISVDFVDWRKTLDISAARCLHTLNCYSAWRDWVLENPNLNENSKDKDLQIFYNRKAMQCHLNELFSNPDQEKSRENIFKVLDRFLSVLLHEKLETKGKRNNKNRAEKYAYMHVKAILLSKSIEERKKFNNSMVIEMIMEKVQEEDLTFSVTETNCRAACQLFETKHGWQKKRQEDRKPRVKRVIDKRKK